MSNNDWRHENINENIIIMANDNNDVTIMAIIMANNSNNK